MITNNGKEIISKYLLGQVPSYATHLAIGCGPRPLDANDTLPNAVYSKQRLDFEMTRVPISSKGFVDDSETFSVTTRILTSNYATLTTSVAHGIIAGETIIVSVGDTAFDGQYVVYDTPTTTTLRYYKVSTDVGSTATSGYLIVSRTKLSLTAELPTENRYEITEVGVWSQGTNVLASQYDSRSIFDFSQSWQLHGTSISDPKFLSIGSSSVVDIPTNADTADAFYVSTSDPVFAVDTRKLRGEGPRNQNSTLLVRGDLSTISGAINANWTGSGDHIHLNGINFNISGNNASDILKLAFSVLDRAAVTSNNITDIKILMEFYKTELTTTSGYAKAQIYVPGAGYLNNYRYYVADIPISQNTDPNNPSNLTTLPYIRFYTSTDFSPSEIRVCRIFVQVTASPDATNHYVCFEGFRIENTTENPLHKLSGYTLIRNSTGVPIVKLPNTNNYVDFRFGLGVS
jgi:hypothetical protein